MYSLICKVIVVLLTYLVQNVGQRILILCSGSVGVDANKSGKKEEKEINSWIS